MSAKVVVAGAAAFIAWKLYISLQKQETKRQKSYTAVSLTITTPDDFHLHLRDGEVLESVVGPSAEKFGRAIIMPNLVPPVVNAKQALAYRDRILAAIRKHRPDGSLNHFVPLMTLYLTDKTTPADIKEAKDSGHVYACKLYPAGATTNSDSGVTEMRKIYRTIKAMADIGMPLLVHSEVTHAHVDIFDREAAFIGEVIRPLLKAVPNIKLVMEHVTTKTAVDFVLSQPANVAATITAHHLLYNRNRIFLKGINPHYYCLPILKTEVDRNALVAAATSGNPKFFAGTDSAPHAVGKKEASCGCAGCYTSFAAVELYAEVFANSGTLECDFEKFMSVNGANFYGLPVNKGKITLVKQPWNVPMTLPLGNSVVVPLRAGERIEWRFQ